MPVLTMKPRIRTWLLPVLLVAALGGCGPAIYRKQADSQVYTLLKEKHLALYGSREIYEIEKMARDPYQDLRPTEAPLMEIPEGVRHQARYPLIVTLEKALEIAVYNSRNYQTQKENLYLTALDLTEERYAFSSQLSSLLSAFWNRTPGEESVSGTGTLNISRLLKTGASIGINLSTEFLRFLTGDPRRTASSILAVNIIQPLWRGAGQDVATENLKQAERDLVYEIRTFQRFRKVFSVSIASSYYRVLQQRAVVRNERRNHQTLQLARERVEMLAKAGRRPDFQVDQARQDELRAKDRWIRAISLYFDLLDRFRIDLGLPTDAPVDLDDSELDRLIRLGPQHPDTRLEEAVILALERRQDLMNVRDRVEDAERGVRVAADALSPFFDLVVDARFPSQPRTHPANLRLDQGDWNAGFNLDLPLNRLVERNAYRVSLIALERAQRAYSLQEDTVKLEIRDAWRDLQQARESSEIQRNSVKLATRRVESTTLLLQAGRADTRDLLEAQAALVEAENALVRALTDHVVARLEFYRDTETLNVTDRGFWMEDPDFSSPGVARERRMAPTNGKLQ